MEKGKKAVIYARQSSGSDDKSASVEAQIENCRRLAQDRGLEVIGVYSDLNTSGKTYPTGAEHIAANDEAFIHWFDTQTKTKKFRPGLGAAFAKLTETRYIIVDDVTRLYRPCKGSFLEAFINRTLEREQVEILQVKGGNIDLSKFDSALITMLRNAINDEQIANCRAKSKQAFRRMRDAGMLANGGGKAWGTAYNVTTKEITIKEGYADIIQMIFNEIENFTPYNQILKAIQARVSGRVYNTTLYHVAENPIYAGYMRNNDGELIRNMQISNPPISFAQWQNVQRIMSGKKKAPNKAKFRFLPFSGLLYCGYCGSRLVSGHENGKIFYYCKDGVNIRHSAECGKARTMAHTEEDVEGQIDLFRAIKPLLIMSLLKDAEDAEKQAADRANIQALRDELAILKQKQVTVQKMFLTGLVDAETMEQALSEHKDRIAELNATIAKADYNEDETTRHLRAFDLRNEADKFLEGALDNETYIKALKKTITRINCYNEYIEVCTVYGAFRIPRVEGKRRMFPPATLTINGRLPEDFSFVVRYETGFSRRLLTTERIKVITE